MVYALICLLSLAAVVGPLWVFARHRPASPEASVLVLGVGVSGAAILLTALMISRGKVDLDEVDALALVLRFVSPSIVLAWWGGSLLALRASRMGNPAGSAARRRRRAVDSVPIEHQHSHLLTRFGGFADPVER